MIAVAMVAETNQKTSKDLWNAAAPLIRRLEKHPFLVDMVYGTLDVESFKYYAIQDAVSSFFAIHIRHWETQSIADSNSLHCSCTYVILAIACTY